MAVELIQTVSGINGPINTYAALSTDTKPTNCKASSQIIETDTGDTYEFNGSSWQQTKSAGALKTAGGGGVVAYNTDGTTPKTQVTTLTSEIIRDVPDWTLFSTGGAVVNPGEITAVSHPAGHLATTVFATPQAKTNVTTLHGMWISINLDIAAHALALQNGGEYVWCPAGKTTRIDMREEITLIHLTSKDFGVSPDNHIELSYL